MSENMWPTRYLQDLVKREDVARAMAMVDDGIGTMVAEIIKISQTPAPTFEEGKRAELLIEIYKSLNMDQVVIDDVGNVISSVTEERTGPCIYLMSHMDTDYSFQDDHNATLDSEKLMGASVVDNSTGLAALLYLANIIRSTPLELNSNIHCVSTVGSKGKGYSTGIKAVLEEKGEEIDVIIGLEGANLGRVGHYSEGCNYLDIICTLSGEVPSESVTKNNAVLIISEIIQEILKLKITSEYNTRVNFGFVEGGEDYGEKPTHSRCGMQICSTDNSSLSHVESRIRFLANKIAAKSNAQIKIELVRRRPNGSIPENHFLVELARDVNYFLNVEPVPGEASSEISVPLSRGIPAVTLGITEGNIINGVERGYINPIATGIKQVLLHILALDSKWEEFNSVPIW